MEELKRVSFSGIADISGTIRRRLASTLSLKAANSVNGTSCRLIREEVADCTSPVETILICLTMGVGFGPRRPGAEKWSAKTISFAAGIGSAVVAYRRPFVTKGRSQQAQ